MSSSIPAATAYYLNLAQTALQPVGGYVWMGTKIGTFSAPITLLITEIIGDQEWAVLGPNYKREETFSITNLMSSYQGDQDLPSRLQEVMSAFALISVAIGNDPTLGGTVRVAQVGGFEFLPNYDPKGQSNGQLKFEVRAEQRVTSLT